MIGAMPRLPAIAAAIALATGLLGVCDGALAKDNRDAPRAEARREQPRAYPPSGWRGNGGVPGVGRPDPRNAPRFDPRSDPRSDPRGDPRGDLRGDPRGDPRGDFRFGPHAYPDGENFVAPRRGSYLGPQGGAPIQDPGRMRLRAAPRGYMWVRVPGGMAIVSRATGQVFDVVPDGR